MYQDRPRGDHWFMFNSQPQPKVTHVVAAALKPDRSAHDRQRDLVRASLLLGR
jgi:hypothetical protein